MPDQPTAKPTNKVTAGAVAGAFVILLTWLLSFGDVELPAEAAAAITTILSTVAAYAVTDE